MTQTLDKKENPLNLGGGWAPSTPFRTWSSCHRGRRGAPISKRRHHYGPKTEYEPSRKQQKQQYGPGPWFQPPRSPYWAMYCNWGCWGGPWCAPPMGCRKPPGLGQVSRMYAPHPVCFCCCSYWRGPWDPGWVRPPGRKKRWGRRIHGLRRHPRHPVQRSPPGDVCGWQEPGLRAPCNTTQYIMNQVYEDMEQQEAPAGGHGAPPSGGEDDAGLRYSVYGFVQNSSLALSPEPEEESQPSAPPLLEREEEETSGEECGDESEGEVDELETQSEEEGEGEEEEEAERIEEEEQREEEKHLPLEMPLSLLVGAEEERKDFINCF